MPELHSTSSKAQSALPEKKRKMRQRIRPWILSGVIVGLLSGLVWTHPFVLFPHRIEVSGVQLCSDRPFSEADARVLIEDTIQRMQAIPDWKPSKGLSAFICNSTWRRRLFFFPSSKAGGLAYYLLPHSFFSGGDIALNQLIRYDGQAVTDERTLSYFLAHEFTHIHHERTVGTWRFHRTPDWIKEGYADFVGRGDAWKRSIAKEGFLNNSPEMTTPVIAPYLRFNLLFSYYHTQMGQSVESLSMHPTSREEAEASLLEALSH